MKTLYFIQTSSQKYNDHEKKRKNLFRTSSNLTVPEYLKGQEISTYYRKQLNCEAFYYVYATTNVTACIDEDVYFLNLADIASFVSHKEENHSMGLIN